MIFFNSFYSIIYVDAFLGLFFAFIVSYIYALKKVDGFGTLTIVMAIFVLTLTKDAALFFALVSALLFTLKLTIFNYESIGLLHKITGRRLITSALSFFSILIAKVSWSHKLSSNDISNNFSGKTDIKEFLSILIDKGLNYRNTDTYRKDVLDSFVDALISPSFQLGSFAMSTVQILVLIAVLFYIVYLLSIKSSNSTSQKKDFILIIIYYSSFLVYIFGLLASYMYKFSEYEAIRVASFNRYISIICAAGLAFVIFLAIKIFLSEDSDSISVPVTLVLSIILIIAPYSSLSSFITRESVYDSIETREPYDALSQTANNVIACESAKIFVISQATTGFDYWVLKYSLRPHSVSNSFLWSLGEPFFDGDVWTVNKSVVELQNILISDGYDYVVIYKLNDYFINNYSSLFENPVNIVENSIYKFDKESLKLILNDVQSR